MKKLTPFPWYGGKYYLLEKLYSEFPKTCDHFVDCFGGSGIVSLNTRFVIRTYNDLNSQVVNFFRILRDESEELIRRINLTPYSQEEFKLAMTDPFPEDLVERARRFYVLMFQGFNSISQSGRMTWGFAKTGESKRTDTWVRRPEHLRQIVELLKNIQLENDEATTIIKRYDSPTTFFYCDPPYIHAKRRGTDKYEFEMSDDDHQRLAETLNSIKGKAMVSGYHSELYSELFKGWRTVEFELVNTVSMGSGNRNPDKKTEVIWTNYEKEENNLLL